MAAWIAYYCERDETILGIINLLEVNVDKLFLKKPAEKPDFALQFSDKLTKNLYVKIVKKIFAVMRHLLYKEIRKVLRARTNKTALSAQISVSGTNKNYLTKNELRKILEEIDIGGIRKQVFALYGLEDEKESEQRTLLKAYYTFMSNRTFEEQVR